jgi:hypothetical protein
VPHAPASLVVCTLAVLVEVPWAAVLPAPAAELVESTAASVQVASALE